MLWVGVGGHRSLLMVMVWIWVQIQRKMLGSATNRRFFPDIIGGGGHFGPLRCLGFKVTGSILIEYLLAHKHIHCPYDVLISLHQHER